VKHLPSAALACVVCLGPVAQAAAQQWPATSLVLRTNGATVRPGECVRLTLLATEEVIGPYTPSVSYAFTRPVTVEGEDQTRRVELRREVSRRPAGATLDRLTAGASVLLDDAFCFGEGSAVGPYEIAVDLRSWSLPGVRLETCVEYHPDAPLAATAARCAFALRGVVRRDVPGWITFDASVGSGGLYRLLAFQGDRVVRVIEDAIAITGPRELSVVGLGLGAVGQTPVDLVLHDLVGNRYASATRLDLRHAPQN
jgi:hypothetical protein